MFFLTAMPGWGKTKNENHPHPSGGGGIRGDAFSYKIFVINSWVSQEAAAMGQRIHEPVTPAVIKHLNL
jgi:hypothetical protein